MTDEELQFHYFKLHDYDNNNMLDGTELISAMTHFHHGKCHYNYHERVIQYRIVLINNSQIYMGNVCFN